jgi:excisionase family DNA binding protein
MSNLTKTDDLFYRSLLNLSEAATVMNRNERTIKKLFEDGSLKFIRQGRQLMTTRAWIDQYLEVAATECSNTTKLKVKIENSEVKNSNKRFGGKGLLTPKEFERRVAKLLK